MGGIFGAAPAPASRPRSASRPRDSGIFSGGPAPARARQPLAAKPRDVLVLDQGSYRPTSAERKDSTRLDPVACRTAGAPREKEREKELPGLPLRPRNGAVGRNLSTSAEGGVFGGGPAPVPKPHTVEAFSRNTRPRIHLTHASRCAGAILDLEAQRKQRVLVSAVPDWRLSPSSFAGRGVRSLHPLCAPTGAAGGAGPGDARVNAGYGAASLP